MYRTAFRNALRAAPRARYMSTRPATLNKTKFAVGTSLVASLLLLLPFAVVGNDTNTEKVENDIKFAQEEAEQVKQTITTQEAPKLESESVPEPETTQPETEESEQSEDSEENHQAAAFNPETGEINWDCPCLGGMAHGPCGEEFKAAFSCFVYSETEPKGIDCITKFEAMRTCFKQHPEHYKEELYEDDVEPVPSTESEQEQAEKVVDVVTADLA